MEFTLTAVSVLDADDDSSQGNLLRRVTSQQFPDNVKFCAPETPVWLVCGTYQAGCKATTGSVRVQRYLIIGLGGALGSMLRYFIGVFAEEKFTTRFPVGTFAINIVACFAIGLSLEWLNRDAGLNPAWRYLIPIGFIGGFSTFSGFEWEAWANFTNGAFWIGISYVAASIVLGLIAVAAGTAAARALA
jgi:CrcB protein